MVVGWFQSNKEWCGEWTYLIKEAVTSKELDKNVFNVEITEDQIVIKVQTADEEKVGTVKVNITGY